MRRCDNIPYTLCFDAPLFMLCDVFADKYQHVFNTFSHLFKAMQQQAITGCLLGTAVGDALGLPYEGLTPRRVHRLFNDLERYHFVLGRGMVSDDTEHACFVAQALLASGGDPAAFEKRLAWSLKWWLLGCPAGLGLATLRSIVKLWLGFSPTTSGVFSAGNGPSMRSALLGVVYGAERARLRDIVQRSTRITHSDPRAYFGALAVAVAAHQSATGKPITTDDYCRALRSTLDPGAAGEFLDLIRAAAASAARRETVSAFALAIGCRQGISGYTYHTVPCVIQTWLRYPRDLRAGLCELFTAGGDTDTVGAIFGGIVGAGVGRDGIPAEWLRHLAEWPRSVRWMERLASELARSSANGIPCRPQRLFVPAVLLRNAVFAALVLAHGLRRLAPPY